MRRRIYLMIMTFGAIAAIAGESNADVRFYNGYGLGGPGFHRYYGYGYGPYGNRGYGYGNGGYIDYGYGRPYGFGISVY